MAAAIETDGLTKYYGKSRGVEDVSLRVEAGEVFGFLGPNGAGKTTTIRLLLDLLRPTSGRARVLGEDAREGSLAIRRRVGYLPGDVALWEKRTGRDLVEYASRVRGGSDPARVASLAARLQCELDRPIGALSKGNRQKVGVLLAFMHDPELLVLDEPGSGLDPLMQRELHALVREAKAAGRTVFLSSHDLSEVERLCDRVAIIREGRIVAVDAVAALKARAARRVTARFARAPRASDFEGVPGVANVRVTDARLACTVTGSVDALVKALAKHDVLDLVLAEPDLEELFLAHYGGGAK